MESKPEPKQWLQTVPGILSAAAAVIGAVATLVVALGGFMHSSPQKSTDTAATVVADRCTDPFVFRLAVPFDHVCVSKESRMRVELENQRAAERRRASSSGYGPDSCEIGYVWREAFDGDTTCVLPERRTQVRQENAQAAERAKH